MIFILKKMISCKLMLRLTSLKPLTFQLAVLSTLELSCYQFNSLAALFPESASFSAPSH